MLASPASADVNNNSPLKPDRRISFFAPSIISLMFASYADNSDSATRATCPPASKITWFASVLPSRYVVRTCIAVTGSTSLSTKRALTRGCNSVYSRSNPSM